KGGFVFEAKDGRPQRIVDWGHPTAQSKLELRAGGLDIRLPFRCDRVAVTVYLAGSKVEMVAADQEGAEVVRTLASAQGLQTVELKGPQIADVHLMRAAEGALVEVCAEPDWRRVDREPEPPALALGPRGPSGAQVSIVG